MEWSGHVWECLRLGFLRVKGIDLTSHEHICQDEIFQNLDSLWRTRFIVLSERFEKIRRCLIPSLYANGQLVVDPLLTQRTLHHPHLPSAFPNDAHDPRVRYSILDLHRSIIYLLRNCQLACPQDHLGS
jgi:hypothetical protein